MHFETYSVNFLITFGEIISNEKADIALYELWIISICSCLIEIFFSIDLITFGTNETIIEFQYDFIGHVDKIYS